MGQNMFGSSVTVIYNYKDYTARGLTECKKKIAEISAAAAMLIMLDNVRKEESKRVM